MTWRNTLLIVAIAFLVGCAYQVRMMSRDSGTVYTGQATGLGKGTVSITVDEKTYTGTWVTVADSGSLTLLNTYGRTSRGTSYSGFGSSQRYSTRGTGVAILSAPDNTGPRCEYQIESGMGIGVCSDDKGRLFDIQIIKQ